MNPPDGADRSFSPIEMNEVMGKVRLAIPFIGLFFGLIVATVVFFVIYSETEDIYFALGIAFALVIAELIGFFILWRTIERGLANVAKRLEEHAAGIGPDGAAIEPIRAETIRFREAAPSEEGIFDTSDTFRSFLLAGTIVGALIILFGTFFGFAIHAGIDTIGGIFFGVIIAIMILGGLYAAKQRLGVLKAFYPGRIHLTRRTLRLNDPVEIHFERRLRRFMPIREVTAALKCVESASYSQGTKRVTATEIVRSIVLPFPLSLSPNEPALRAAWRVILPPSGPASFKGKNNKIEWRLELMITPEEGVADDSVFMLDVAPEVMA
jgi:hypothetical protein